MNEAREVVARAKTVAQGEMQTSASLRARLKILLGIRKMVGDSLALVVGTNQIRREEMAIDHTNFFNVSTILSKRLRALQ